MIAKFCMFVGAIVVGGVAGAALFAYPAVGALAGGIVGAILGAFQLGKTSRY